MKEIQLTQNKVALVDDEDFEYLNQFKWCAAKLSGIFYAVRNAPRDGKRYMYFMHRVIMQTPDGMQTDHKSGETLDNRRCNLRVCSVMQNGHNSNAASLYANAADVSVSYRPKYASLPSGLLICASHFFLDGCQLMPLCRDVPPVLLFLL